MKERNMTGISPHGLVVFVRQDGLQAEMDAAVEAGTKALSEELDEAYDRCPGHPCP